ncbi:MAG TPA: hypothetical protein DCM28_02725 [Phycisphaerales bacterium]|nr:hypothetical protein [Phycisphaerales bacterium]
MNEPTSNPGPTSLMHQLMMLIGLCIANWLAMMLIHELGHILGALVTGGQVNQLIWHPLVLSRTDVLPNPSPLIVVWAGPLLGVILPIIITALTRWLYRPACYIAVFFTGFCLLANGLYLGLGWIDQIGDAGTMQTHGTPIWIMICFGLLCIPSGLYLWHRVSQQVGLSRTKHARVQPTHARLVLIIALVCLAVGLVVGNHG